MHAVMFRSYGEPFGADLSATVLSDDTTHAELQERLKVRDADGAWSWVGEPDEPGILAALRDGRTIGSVDGAALLTLHPDHGTRWDKSTSLVYWGAVEALYAADPDAPSLSQLLPLLERVRSRVDPKMRRAMKSVLDRLPTEVQEAVRSASGRGMLTAFAETGQWPAEVEAALGAQARLPFYAARLVRPQTRKEVLAALLELLAG